mmetsp:Transcript_11128/g.18324  ORF Transcript_11128/g.18324 Transcript_11128/m.18324 type:complete len:201 (-) Transcript_11128:2008-2610(-)
MPTSFGPIMVLIFSTAFNTPFPMYLSLSPSRSSRASYIPVDAPLGTAARNIPKSVTRSTSIVGFPRESKISLAPIHKILVSLGPNCFKRGIEKAPGAPVFDAPRQDQPPHLPCPTTPTMDWHWRAHLSASASFIMSQRNPFSPRYVTSGSCNQPSMSAFVKPALSSRRPNGSVSTPWPSQFIRSNNPSMAEPLPCKPLSL